MINKLCGDETYLNLSSGDKYNTSVLLASKRRSFGASGSASGFKTAESHQTVFRAKQKIFIRKKVFVIWSKNKPLELELVDLWEHFSVWVKWEKLQPNICENWCCASPTHRVKFASDVWLWHQKFICPNQPEHLVYINCKLAHKGRHRGASRGSGYFPPVFPQTLSLHSAVNKDKERLITGHDSVAGWCRQADK